MSRADNNNAAIKMKSGGSEDPDGFLAAEYSYIAQSAFYANEDRARVTNFYLVTIGGFIAGILGGNFSGSNSSAVTYGFILFFALLTVQGWLTILQLAKLRLAWFSSINAMNKIKSYYLEKYQDLKDFQIFDWNQSNTPPQFSKQSIGFYLAVQVSLLTGFTAASAAGLSVSEFAGKDYAVPAAGAAFLLAGCSSLNKYRSLLMVKSAPKTSIE